MTIDRIASSLTEAFEKVGPAHHQAFAATDGDDPEWPLWYAEFLIDDLRQLLGAKLTKSKVVYCLMAASEEHEARGRDTPWPGSYAEHFAARLAPADAPTTDRLSLYYYPACPFCQRVLGAVERLGVTVDLRDIRVDREHFDELVGVRGRATVPVLLIESAGGESRWMPESADIIDYLEASYRAGS